MSRKLNILGLLWGYHDDPADGSWFPATVNLRQLDFIMRRREFIGLAATSALSLARPARAQPAAMPVVGFLHSGSPEQNAARLAGYLKGLRDAGFVDGQRVGWISVA